MLRYVISLLLTSTYYCGSGLPLNNDTVLVAVHLQKLAEKCVDKVIAQNILDGIKYCNTSTRVNSKNGLMCMMFYDINSQLCSEALKTINPNFNNDSNKKITQYQSVNTICTSAQSWSFGDIPDHTEYRLLSEKILKNKNTCLKACAGDDITSDDSNFHCKYFKWAIDVLDSHKDHKDSKPDNTPVLLVETKTSSSNVTQSTIKNINEDSNDIKPIIGRETGVGLASSHGSMQKPETEAALPESIGNNSTSTKKDDLTNGATSKKLPVEESAKESIKPIIETPPNIVKELPIENPKMKSQNDIEDDQDDDDDHDDDGLGDQIGGDLDGDEQAFNADPKLEFDKSKSNEKRIESITSFNGEMSQRGIFPNTIQDTFGEDDDHFFPFFMTVIVVVVLLYVLYHNKSKFTKVLLGLIVEGRQSGRRRNSRGHAYRRLDTLEQAMSTNTAAPPSKIIY